MVSTTSATAAYSATVMLFCDQFSYPTTSLDSSATCTSCLENGQVRNAASFQANDCICQPGIPVDRAIFKSFNFFFLFFFAGARGIHQSIRMFGPFLMCQNNKDSTVKRVWHLAISVLSEEIVPEPKRSRVKYHPRNRIFGCRKRWSRRISFPNS